MVEERGDHCILCGRSWRKPPHRVSTALLCCCLKDVHYSCMQKATLHGVDCPGCGYPLSVEKALLIVHTLYNVYMSSYISLWFILLLHMFLSWLYLHKTKSSILCSLLTGLQEAAVPPPPELPKVIGSDLPLHQDHLLSTGHPSPPYLKRYETTVLRVQEVHPMAWLGCHHLCFWELDCHLILFVHVELVCCPFSLLQSWFAALSLFLTVFTVCCKSVAILFWCPDFIHSVCVY